METTKIYTNRLNEFKVLSSKIIRSKGYTGGLTTLEYYRVCTLHSYLLSTLEGKTDNEKRLFFKTI